MKNLKYIHLIITVLFLTLAHPLPLLAQEQKASKDDVIIALSALEKTAKAFQADIAGDTASALKLRQEIITDYDKLIAKNPKDFGSLNARAATKEAIQKGMGKEDFNQVITITTPLIAAHTSDFKIFKARGNAYSGLGMYDNAKSDFNSAIAVAPEKEKKRLESKLKMLELKLN